MARLTEYGNAVVREMERTPYPISFREAERRVKDKDRRRRRTKEEVLRRLNNDHE